MFGQRILILVPHPDDEVVACSAAIGRAQEAGARIFALYLTHGCIARQTLWPWQRWHYDARVQRRRAEGEAVAKSLGITPVGWSTRPARYLWREMVDANHEIQAAVTTHAIDQLWVPAYEGGNADHDALNAIAQKYVSSLSVLEFAEYNFSGGKTCAQSFPAPTGLEQQLKLSMTEKQYKTALLALYASEQNNLGYVGVDHESYRPLASYDYAAAPHPGKLWYTRFQWVPFHHPRVDFTKPHAVSESIRNFLKLA